MAKTSKNKTKEWRKQSRVVDPTTGILRRVGRMYRNIRMNYSGKAYPNEMVILLMKHAGIHTPVFDERLSAVKQRAADLKVTRETIEDVTVDTELKGA